jgi:endonuclease/exonuclease/phosphatase family metal-dependent hydrolase
MAGLSVLTFNCWFEDDELEQRAAALFADIQTHAYDIVGLQEVTPPLLALLRAHVALCAEFALSSDALCPAEYEQGEGWEMTNTLYGGVRPYGCVLLVRTATCGDAAFEVTDLPGGMERTLISAVLPALGGLTVGVVHLESLGTQPTREEQLEIITAKLDSAAAVAAAAAGGGGGPGQRLLLGDFNFDARRPWNPQYTGPYDGVAAADEAAAVANEVQEEEMLPEVQAMSPVHALRTPSPVAGEPSRLPEEIAAAQHDDNACLRRIMGPSGYVDCWSQMHDEAAGDFGFTFDSELNGNCQGGARLLAGSAAATARDGGGGKGVAVAGTYEQMRYDRIMAALPAAAAGGYRLSSVELALTEPLPVGRHERWLQYLTREQLTLWPSDHFGVVADLAKV